MKFVKIAPLGKNHLYGTTYGMQEIALPVLSVNIESMDDVTSGVAHALVLLKANSLCLLFFIF